MEKFLQDKFKYYTFYVLEDKKTVIATCRFAGRTIRATAVCHPNDEFDVNIGQRVAMLKCERKCAKIRLNNAINKLTSAIADRDDATERIKKYEEVYARTLRKYEELGGK